MSNDEHDPHAEEKLAKAKYDAEVAKPNFQPIPYYVIRQAFANVAQRLWGDSVDGPWSSSCHEAVEFAEEVAYLFRNGTQARNVSDEEASSKNCTGTIRGGFDPDCKACQAFLAGVAHARKHPDPVLMACFRHMYSAIGKHLMNQNTANRWPDPGLKLARSKAAEYLEAKEGKA